MTYEELQAHVKGGAYHLVTPDELRWILDQMDRHEDTVNADWWELRLWVIRN